MLILQWQLKSLHVLYRHNFNYLSAPLLYWEDL